jgi:hypothetical protein
MRANLSYRELKQLIAQASFRAASVFETYSDEDIALTYLWAQLHEQPSNWACQKKVWPPGSRFTPPSQSCLSRRLRTVKVIELMGRVRGEMIREQPSPPLKLIDCRPLETGNSSHDRDSRRGRSAGYKGRGYKLCVVVSGGLVRSWTLGSLNENDQVLAARLMPGLSSISPQGWGYLWSTSAGTTALIPIPCTWRRPG